MPYYRIKNCVKSKHCSNFNWLNKLGFSYNAFTRVSYSYNISRYCNCTWNCEKIFSQRVVQQHLNSAYTLFHLDILKIFCVEVKLWIGYNVSKSEKLRMYILYLFEINFMVTLTYFCIDTFNLSVC